MGGDRSPRSVDNGLQYICTKRERSCVTACTPLTLKMHKSALYRSILSLDFYIAAYVAALFTVPLARLFCDAATPIRLAGSLLPAIIYADIYSCLPDKSATEIMRAGENDRCARARICDKECIV